MKKLMCAVAALATGVVMADGIASANVVGYSQTSLLPNDYTMFAMQFEGTDGNGVKFGDLTGNFYGGASLGEADNIFVWKTDGYHNYYYGVWNDPENPSWDNHWYDGDVDVSDETIDAGTACWYLRRSDAEANLTISGQVKVTSTTTTILASDYTMFANPYPTAIKFKDISVADPFGGASLGEADNIFVWKTDGYHNYYYGVWGVSEWDNRWYEGDNDVSEEEIAVGVACWYLRHADTATTISFASPIAE